MPVLSSSVRASTFEPSASAQAHRALRRAEGSLDTLASLSATARELQGLITQCSESAEQLQGRRRAAQALQSERLRALELADVAEQAGALTRRAEELQAALADVEESLGRLQLGEADARRRADLLDEVGEQGDALVALMEQVAALEGGQAVGRQGRADRMAELSRGQEAQAAGAAKLRAEQAAAGAARLHLAHHLEEQQFRQPPGALRPSLDGFVQEWNGIVRDPRGLEQPGSAAALENDGRVAALQGRWADWNLRTQAPKSMDPNEMTMWIMRQAYRDNTQDMRSYAIRLEFHTAVKARLRDELNRARQWRAQHTPTDDSGNLTAPFQKHNVSLEPNIDAEGNWHPREPQPGEELTSADGLKEYVRELEQALQSAGDDMQLANIELQVMTQRQQQMLNTLSSLSKAQHETSMAILRKIGT